MSHERQATRALPVGVQMGSSSPLFGGSERTPFAVIADGLPMATHKRNTLPQAVILGMMSRRSVTPAGSQEPVPSLGSGFGIRRNDDLKALATPSFSIRYRNVLVPYRWRWRPFAGTMERLGKELNKHCAEAGIGLPESDADAEDTNVPCMAYNIALYVIQ